jgi:hypothetical protein
MPTITITRVETDNEQGQDVALFNPYSDLLKAAAFCNASADLLGMPNLSIDLTFEMISFLTNEVVSYRYDTWNLAADDSAFLVWRGSTPQNWGLQWAGNDLFGVRVSIKVNQATTEGTAPVDAMDVSEIKWFRLEDVFTRELCTLQTQAVGP